MKRRSLALLLLLLPALFSCKKGPVGPAGPSGPQGAVGTPNVIYSGWLVATNVRDTTIDNTLQQVATLAAPELNQPALDHALIQVYLRFNGQAAPLPYTTLAAGKSSTISFLPQPGRFLITRITLDGSNDVGLRPDISYRYIIVPGSVPVNGRLRAGTMPDWSNYAAVAAFYGLKD